MYSVIPTATTIKAKEINKNSDTRFSINQAKDIKVSEVSEEMNSHSTATQELVIWLLSHSDITHSDITQTGKYAYKYYNEYKQI